MSDRRPSRLPGVFRDGKLLVVVRGADISRYCLCCGRPATGNRITKHLFTPMDTSTSGSSHGTTGSDPLSAILLVIQLILLLFFLLMLVAEWFSSRKRTVTFGLCELHHRQRKNLKTLVWCCIFAGIGLMVLGIKLANHLPHPATWLATTACLGTFTGGALLWVAAIILGTRAPSLSLRKEQAAMLWVKGAGESFLNAQTPLPAGEPAKAKK